MNGKRFTLIACSILALTLGASMIFMPPFFVTLLAYLGLSSMTALGLVLLTGVGGLTSFGHAAFVGIGAYATAYLTTAFGLSPWLGLFAGIILTLAIGFALGLVTLRLSGHYLPLSTLAWGLGVYYLLGNIPHLGGHTGLTGVPSVGLLGFELDSSRKVGIFIWCLMLCGILMVTNLLDSRPGRAIRALKGGVLMAESVGVNTTRIKMIIFIYSALLASLSGWLYAHLVGFVNPSPFSVRASVEYLFMTVLGGASYVWGALVGAGVFTFVKRWLQDVLPILLGNRGNFEQVVFGVLIIVLMHVTRGGIMNWLDGLWQPGVPRDTATPATGSSLHSLPVREKPSSQGPVLKVENVRRNFGGLVAVNNLSLEVRRGEIVGLIGPNGAGKSTLFSMISGVLPVSAGEIYFCGRRIDKLPSHRIAAAGVARTFQHPILLKRMSVVENVMLGAYLRTDGGVIAASFGLNRNKEERLRAVALEQLDRVGLAACANVRAGNLALGQQRMLEIARALCADPMLLLLDEPAAGLRYGEKQTLANLLRKLRMEGVDVLLVEHDMDFVMNLVDRIVALNFGNWLAEGTPAEIRSNSKVLEAYLGTPE